MKSNLVYLIYGGVTVSLVTFTTSLLLAYWNGHITYAFPYISDSGTLPPESCYFGQGLNVLWVIVSVMVYIKNLQVRHILSTGADPEIKNLNKWAFNVGLLSALGMSLVGNFQELNSIYVHWTGAVMTYGFGAIYACLQSILYTKLKDVIGQRKRTVFRIFLSVIAILAFISFFVNGMIAYSLFHASNYLGWTKEDGGFEFHLASAVSEWICSASILIFYIMFYSEFKQITLYEPDISIEIRS